MNENSVDPSFGLDHCVAMITGGGRGLGREYGISVFALSPGGPTAMAEILATSPKVSEELRESARATVKNGSGIMESVEMLLFLLSGKADKLTGRHISFWDSRDELLRRSDEIIQNDLYTLGLRI